jgi:1,4-dihydroxy-2-naphthoate polyprenyltransferase
MNETTVRLTGGGRVPLKIWVAAARPRTLPAAIAPVLVGTALAIADGVFRPLAFAAALVGSVFIQIGTNLANDYSDARRGADTADRLGPVRVTASGLVAPRQVLVATWLAFGVAVLFGIYLIALVGWELLLIGAASILAGVLYTGGPRPYGYEGLGELFVFLFFGVVAVVGSYYVQTEDFDGLAFALSVPVGLLAAAILVVNNIRDIDTDRRVGKRTLAVRLGRNNTRLLYTAILWGAFGWTLGLAIGEELWLLLAAAMIALLGPSLSRTVTTRTDGPSLNGALAGTARLLAVYSLVLSAGVLLGY